MKKGDWGKVRAFFDLKSEEGSPKYDKAQLVAKSLEMGALPNSFINLLNSNY